MIISVHGGDVKSSNYLFSHLGKNQARDQMNLFQVHMFVKRILKLILSTSWLKKRASEQSETLETDVFTVNGCKIDTSPVAVDSVMPPTLKNKYFLLAYELSTVCTCICNRTVRNY